MPLTPPTDLYHCRYLFVPMAPKPVTFEVAISYKRRDLWTSGQEDYVKTQLQRALEQRVMELFDHAGDISSFRCVSMGPRRPS